MNSKRIFCFAPWVHSHYTMTGKRALCCVAKPFDKESQTLEEYWNSSVMKKARLAMMSGRPPEDSCQVCIQNTNNSFLPSQMFDDYEYLTEEIFANTKPDGSYDTAPRYYDYRMENLCNLSCRMCNPHASSKIEGLWRTVLSPKAPRIESLLLKKNTLIEEIGPEFEAAIDRGEVEKIYWASGEAFFQESHWKLIKRIQDNGFGEQTTLKYNTNLNYPFKTLEKFIKKLEGFKKVILIVSIDGVEETGEFIRDGLKWNTFQRALKEIEETSFISIERFNVTVTIPGLLDLPPLLQFLSYKSIELNVSLCDLGDQSSLLSPLSLDRDLLDELIAKAEKDLSKYRESYIFDSFSTVLKNLKKVELSEFRNTTELINSFYESSLLDSAGKRGSLIEYYLLHDISKRWLAKLLVNYSIESKVGNYHDQFWRDTMAEENQSVDYHFAHNALEFERVINFSRIFYSVIEQKEIKYCYIGSYPSHLSRYFTKDACTQKYEPYHFILDPAHSELISFNKIGFFTFIFRRFVWLKAYLQYFDSFILLILPDFYMQYRAVFKLKKTTRLVS